jgi:hypothetical protein
MSERELLLEITRIASDAANAAEATRRMQARLALEIGSAMILLRPPGAAGQLFANSPISEFMESREFPFRGLYVEPLAVRGKEAGTLVACFGSWGGKGEFLQRAAAHASEQLAALLARVHRGALPKEEAA